MTRTPEALRKLFWDRDIKNGGYIYNQYLDIKDTLEKQEISKVQQNLLAIKKYAIENSKFYSSYNIDDDFPVLNKLDFLNNYDLIRVEQERFLDPIHTATTSGSTGIPFSVVQNHEKRCRTIADLKVFGELAKYPSHEVMIYFRAMTEKLKKIRTQEKELEDNIFFIDTSKLDDASLHDMYEEILKKRPNTIFSYPTTFEALSTYLEENHISCCDLGIISILVGGEIVSEQLIARLEKLFSAPVVPRYSNLECGILHNVYRIIH